MIYLDNSATSYPKPQEVRMKMMRALNEFGANPGRSGYAMSIKTSEAVFSCRKEVADFFGCEDPERVIFQPSCTQAMNMVLKGCLKPGDHVLISDLEHNAVIRPLHGLTEQGITYTVVKTCPGDHEKTLQAFRSAFSEKTKLVVCTHASNVFGIRLPVERLAALAHFYGAKICVDCAQTAGIVPINMTGHGIDYLCAAGHKGLYGPMGTGLLLLGRGEELETLVEGGTGTNSRELCQPQDPPERYESGTQNISGIAGIQAGIQFVKRMRPEKLYQQEMAEITYLYEALEKMPHVELYTAKPEIPFFVPVLSFNIKDKCSEDVGEYLAAREIAVRCGLHCAPLAHSKMGTQENGTVRVSPSAFTKKNEMDMLLRRVRELK